MIRMGLWSKRSFEVDLRAGFEVSSLTVKREPEDTVAITAHVMLWESRTAVISRVWFASASAENLQTYSQ